MPRLRRDDPARSRGGTSLPHTWEDRRPAPPRLTEPRNGIPSRRHPYTYRGTGTDELTPWMDDAALPVAPVRALSPAARLDVCEAIDGPDWLDWHERRDEEGAA